MTKICNRCSIEKPLNLFFKDKTLVDGHAKQCKACKTAKTMEWRTKNKDHYNASMREYQAKNKDARRDCDYKRTYGITLEEYDFKKKEQGDVCEMCKQPPKGARPLAVDHNHITGQVRGLLCYGCNRILHGFDNKKIYDSAISYLEKYSKKD